MSDIPIKPSDQKASRQASGARKIFAQHKLKWFIKYYKFMGENLNFPRSEMFTIRGPIAIWLTRIPPPPVVAYPEADSLFDRKSKLNEEFPAYLKLLDNKHSCVFIKFSVLFTLRFCEHYGIQNNAEFALSVCLHCDVSSSYWFGKDLRMRIKVYNFKNKILRKK